MAITVYTEAESQAYLRDKFGLLIPSPRWGVHLMPSAADGPEFRHWADAAKHLGSTWTTTLTCYLPELQYLASLGIQPVCRPQHRANQDWGDDHAVVENMLAAGHRPFVQGYNEPESNVENPGGEPDLGGYIRRWIGFAETIHARGGYPGIQLMDPEWLEDLLDTIIGEGRNYLLEYVFFCCHNYSSNHPDDWPYDRINQLGVPLSLAEIDRIRQDPLFYPGPEDESRVLWWTNFINDLRWTNKNPGQTIYDDWKGFLAPLKWNEVFVRKIGRSVPIIVTEGLVAVGDNQDGRYIRVNEEDHRDRWLASRRMFQTGILPNGDPVPHYWFAITGWLIASELAAGPPNEFEANALYSDMSPKPLTIAALETEPILVPPDPTPLPEPTPVPVPLPTEPFNKLGAHAQESSADLLAALIRIKPRSVKVMFHDRNFMTDLRAALPDIFVTGRLFEQNQVFVDDPARRGREFADRILDNTPAAEFYDAVESYNEWYGYNNPNAWVAADQFQASFYDRIRERCPRLEPIAGNCGTGNLLGSDWLNYFPETLKRYRLYGFHEYAWPDMRNDPWRVLRYRKIMPDILSQRPDALAIITECTITQAVIQLHDVGFWSAMTPEEFWPQLKWYNDRLNEDEYVLSAEPFEVGGRWDWASFEILNTSIIDRMAELPKGPPIDLSTSPIPEPEVPPMSLAEMFPVNYALWTQLGGDSEESFRFHLQGIGVLPVTQESVDQAVQRVQAHVSEIAKMQARVPKV